MYKKFIKRIIDFTCALLLIIILSPILLMVALLVKLTSRGPVLYKGMRTGYKGKTIYISKFRSMVANADAVGGDLAIGSDPRITKFGKLMRITKLDELPQLFDILSGKMSFIGPRPELVRCAKNFKGRELEILNVRPGLTDFSSVYFVNMEEVVTTTSTEEDYENRILKVKNKLRLKYVDEISFFTDLKLLFLTAFAIIGKIFKITKHKYPRASGKPTVAIYSQDMEEIRDNHLQLIDNLIESNFDVFIISEDSDAKHELLARGCKVINQKYKKHPRKFVKKINASIIPDFVLTYGAVPNTIISNRSSKLGYNCIMNLTTNDQNALLNDKNIVKQYTKSLSKALHAYCEENDVLALLKNNLKITVAANPDQEMSREVVEAIAI